jgi:hypothetical protein
MLRYMLSAWQQQHRALRAEGHADRSLTVVLWALWTLTVVVVGYTSWHADVGAGQPVNLLGLVIHCAVTGLVGLVVLTKVEMWLQPWRFVDDEHSD